MNATPHSFTYQALLFEQVERARDGSVFFVQSQPEARKYLADLIEESGKDITFKSHPLSAREVNSFDFVFIENPSLVELETWYGRVRPGGLITGTYPESRDLIHQFAAAVGHGMYGDGAASPVGYSCFGIPKPLDNTVHIFLGLPNYDGTGNAKGIMRASQCAYSGTSKISVMENHTSLLASNFNQLWALALSDPSVTHFAMLHSDIVPSAWWLDVLMHELEATGSHMVSVVVPIKDAFGVTSTGIYSRQMDGWCPHKRFSMTEIMNMPATFDAEMAGFPGSRLILNTGCWMADLRDDRWKMEDENGELVAKFTIQDRITRDEDGRFICWTKPEDFNFSETVQRLGFRAMATRKVQLEHFGMAAFPNDKPWGLWKSDEMTKDLWDRPAASLQLQETGV